MAIVRIIRFGDIRARPSHEKNGLRLEGGKRSFKPQPVVLYFLLDTSITYKSSILIKKTLPVNCGSSSQNG